MTIRKYSTPTHAPATLANVDISHAVENVADLITENVKPKTIKRLCDAMDAHASQLDHCGWGDRVVSIREPTPRSPDMVERMARAKLIRYLTHTLREIAEHRPG